MRQPRPSAPVGRAALLATALAVILAGCSPGTPPSSSSSSPFVVPTSAAASLSPSPSPAPSAAPASGFTRGPDLVPPRWWHTATRLRDGRVLVVGGEPVDPSSGATAPPTLDRADLFDPVTDTWSTAAALHQPRQLHTATLLADGRVLVLGGSAVSVGNRADPVPGGEVFDPVVGNWSPITPPPAQLIAQPVSLADGTVLVVGDDMSHVGRTVAERYDPRTDRWTTLSKPPSLAIYATATLLTDGRVLYAGGSYPGAELPSAERTVALYDPKPGTWRTGPDLPEGVFGHVAVALPDGRVLVSGSGAAATVGVTYLFDPTATSWVTGRSPGLGRIGAAAALIADGRVLVVGNSACTTRDPVAETFNPENGTWTAAGTFPEISGLTATALADGRVLVAGGQPCDGTPRLDGNVFLFGPPR